VVVDEAPVLARTLRMSVSWSVVDVVGHVFTAGGKMAFCMGHSGYAGRTTSSAARDVSAPGPPANRRNP
jgi:hypothetical protein